MIRDKRNMVVLVAYAASIASTVFLWTGCQMVKSNRTGQSRATGSWPMPRHDTALTGHTCLRGRIQEPRVQWRYALGAAKCTRLWTADIDGDGDTEILTGEAGGFKLRR